MDQIVLVTGANSGVGFEVVRALAQRGFTVYLGSRDEGRGQTALAELAGEGDIRLCRIDVTVEEDRRAALKQIEDAHGRLDVLINNAGAALSGAALVVDPDVLRESLALNFEAPSRLLQLAVPLLRKSKAARVVNVTSGAGSLAWMQSPPQLDPATLPFSYCTAKAACNAATILFAHALAADGIKVNAVTPGTVKTRVSRFHGAPPSEGARIVVEMATLGPDGPTGGFFGPKGALPW